LPWLVAGALGCAPNVVIGADAPPVDASTVLDAGAPTDASPVLDASAVPDAGPPLDATFVDSGLTPIPFPWSTGFENGFSDYASSGSFCYLSGGGTLGIVTSPVHSGAYAASFTVSTDGGSLSQTRCKLSGALPQSAYYSAWYYVPVSVNNRGLWNLIHFDGATGPNAAVHGLWDISLVNGTGGTLELTSYDFLHTETPDSGGAPPIPIGSWFRIEIFLKRASDNTGRFTLLQDGVVIVDLNGLETDDTPWGEFFVGNLASSLVPSDVTVYVDDVMVAATP
jgi:hypothetical protein